MAQRTHEVNGRASADGLASTSVEVLPSDHEYDPEKSIAVEHASSWTP